MPKPALFLLRQHSLYVLDGIGSRLINFQQDLEHRFVGLPRAVALSMAPDGEVTASAYRKSSCRDTRCKSRGVQFVVGMQDECDVERRCSLS